MFCQRPADADSWSPHVQRVLERHGIEATHPLSLGEGATFPTLIGGDVVVKFFGDLPSWRRAYRAETAANRCIAGDSRILAPNVLAQGQLFNDANSPWPYLVTQRVAGANWEDASLSFEDKLLIATELGRQVGYIQALDADADVARDGFWPAPNLAAAARRTVLPSRLTEQVDRFVAGMGAGDRVLAHGDLMFRHVFVEDGRLSGIVDWGDAMVADPHYELAQLQLNLFDGNKALLRALLDAANWPVGRTFARQALAQAFHRQATGLAQHGRMDVFHKLPTLLPLDDVATLGELADLVFGV